MNRIFHVKIAGGTYFLLVLVTAVLVFGGWCRVAVVGVGGAVGRSCHGTCFLVYEGNDRIGSSIGSDHYY